MRYVTRKNVHEVGLPRCPRCLKPTFFVIYGVCPDCQKKWDWLLYYSPKFIGAAMAIIFWLLILWCLVLGPWRS